MKLFIASVVVAWFLYETLMRELAAPEWIRTIWILTQVATQMNKFYRFLGTLCGRFVVWLREHLLRAFFDTFIDFFKAMSLLCSFGAFFDGYYSHVKSYFTNIWNESKPFRKIIGVIVFLVSLCVFFIYVLF
jgi:hypothetical protein